MIDYTNYMLTTSGNKLTDYSNTSPCNNRIFKEEDGTKTWYDTSGVNTLTEYNGNAEWEVDYVFV